MSKIVYNSTDNEYQSVDKIKEDILHRLEEVGKRKDNWDGMGSKGVNPKSVENAKNVLFKMIDTIADMNEPKWVEPTIRDGVKTDESVDTICQNLHDVFDKK